MKNQARTSVQVSGISASDPGAGCRPRHPEALSLDRRERRSEPGKIGGNLPTHCNARAAFAGIVAAAVLSLHGARALAQRADDSELTGARQGVLSDATAASNHGDHARALDLAMRAAQMQMTPSLRLFIAGEQYALGQLAEAYGSATTCVREAQATPALNQRDVILSECRRMMAQITPRLGSVVVQMPNVPDGAVVRVGNMAVPPVLYGAPVRVTPGNVEVNVTAPGFAPFHATVPVAAGASAPVAVSLEREQTATIPTGGEPGHGGAAEQSEPQTPTHSTSANAPPATAEQPTHPATTSSEPSHSPPAPAIALLVLGAAVLVAGAAFVGVAYSDVGSLQTHDCLPQVSGSIHCQASEQGRYNQDVLFQGFGIGGLIGGSVLAIAGVIWFAARGSHTERPSTGLRGVRPTFSVGPSGGMMAIGGAF